MRLKISIFLLLAVSAISLVSYNAQSQNVVGDLTYYELITDIISRDTLVSDWQNKIIEARVQSGQLERKDSSRYSNIIKATKLSLFFKKADSLARDALVKDMQENQYLMSYLSKEDLTKAIDKLPEIDGLHDTSNISREIKLIAETPKWESLHKFSSPVMVEKNLFLIYHYKSTGRFNYKYGVVLFSLGNNDDYEIKQEVTLKQVIM
jgi:hypothetical protein